MNQFQSISEVLSALRRRALLILIIVAIGCAASLQYALKQAKIYEATAIIQIEDAKIPDQLAGSSAPSTDSAHRLRLIEQRLMSRDNLLLIMEKYDLFADAPQLSLNEKIFQLREAARITQIVNQQQSWQPSNTPSGLMIAVRMADPNLAAEVANDLMNRVIDVSRERSLGRARDTLDFFATEENRIGQEILALEERIAVFKRDNSESLPAGQTALRTQLINLQDSELALEQEILTLQNNAGRQRLDVLENQINLLEEQRQLITARIQGVEELLNSSPEVEREFNIMERQLSQLQDQYSVVTRRKAEAELGQVLEDRQQSERFEVLESALPPEFPVSRSRKKLAIMGGLASVIVAFAAAIGLELATPRIRTAAQMERMLGMQPVISVPRIHTSRETNGRRFAWIAGLVALVVAVPFSLRELQDRLGDLGLFNWISTESR